MSTPLVQQVIAAFEAEDGLDRKDVLDAVAALSKRLADHVKKHTTVTTTVGLPAHLSGNVDLAVERRSVDEWGGSFWVMADELVRVALENVGQVDAGGVVEVVWIDEDEQRRHSKGTLIEADGSNLIFADEATIDRNDVIAFGLSY